jgi:hypothetical protein
VFLDYMGHYDTFENFGNFAELSHILLREGFNIFMGNYKIIFSLHCSIRTTFCAVRISILLP